LAAVKNIGQCILMYDPASLCWGDAIYIA